MVDGDSRQRKGKNAGRPAAERAPVSRYASSTDGGGNGNGMQELLAGEVPDLVLSILAAVNCCTPLWEQARPPRPNHAAITPHRQVEGGLRKGEDPNGSHL